VWHVLLESTMEGQDGGVVCVWTVQQENIQLCVLLAARIVQLGHTGLLPGHPQQMIV